MEQKDYQANFKWFLKSKNYIKMVSLCLCSFSSFPEVNYLFYLGTEFTWLFLSPHVPSSSIFLYLVCSGNLDISLLVLLWAKKTYPFLSRSSAIQILPLHCTVKTNMTLKLLMVNGKLSSKWSQLVCSGSKKPTNQNQTSKNPKYFTLSLETRSFPGNNGYSFLWDQWYLLLPRKPLA